MAQCDCTHAGAGSPEGFVGVHLVARLTPWGGKRICAHGPTPLREVQERVPPAFCWTLPLEDEQPLACDRPICEAMLAIPD